MTLDEVGVVLWPFIFLSEDGGPYRYISGQVIAVHLLFAFFCNLFLNIVVCDY